MASSSRSSYSSDSESDYQSAVSDCVVESVLTERAIFPMSRKEKNARAEFAVQLAGMSIGEDDEDIVLVHDNQRQLAQDICRAFEDREILNVMAVAQPQWGKTGSMLAVIELIDVPIDNVFIITGLSSLEWKEQTKERMPDRLKPNVFHRQDLGKDFKKKIEGKTNVLVIIDEVHIASKTSNTIGKVFRELGLGLVEEGESGEVILADWLYENDIKILEYSATPNGTLYDHRKWGGKGVQVFARDSPAYTGPIDLFDAGRVFSCRHLEEKDKEGNVSLEPAKELMKTIRDRFPEPRYHLIRPPMGFDCEDIQSTLSVSAKMIGLGKVSFKTYDMHSDFDLNEDILKKSPRLHTFILLKEKCRCAKTLYKRYIGVLYERYVLRASDSVGIQGLLGRNCGYDTNKDSIVFTNIACVDRYRKCWEKKFSADCLWNSDTTKNVRDKTKSTGTFVMPIKQEEVGERDTPVIVFEDEALMREFLEANMRRFVRCRMNDEGFLYTGPKKVWDLEEAVENRRRHGEMDDPQGRRIYLPCYMDKTDNRTLRYAVPVSREYRVRTLEDLAEYQRNRGY